jgi:hypothetical protein
MENTNSLKPAKCIRAAAMALFATGMLVAQIAQAQMPPRFYWKTLDDANAVPLIVNSISGNTNPFDPSHRVTGSADIDATLAMTGYAQTFSLFDRSAMAAIILPMGRLSGDVVVNGRSTSQSAKGFGDPMLEFTLNLIGPKSQKDIPATMRYEPGFSVDVLADLVLPIGEYDSKNPLNIGMNRWYGRVGMPVNWQLGPWVTGRRTTLEFLPSVWVFGDNKDPFNAKKLETDPKFQLDAHLTRDFAEKLWGSLDFTWYKGGKNTIDGVSGDKLNTKAMGVTLGYNLNDNTNLTFGYKSTVNDSGASDMRMDAFMVSLVFGWHPMVEGMRRLQGR